MFKWLKGVFNDEDEEKNVPETDINESLEEEIEDIRYDDYFTSYKLYPYKLKDTNITDDGYSGSLVDYIKNNSKN